MRAQFGLGAMDAGSFRDVASNSSRQQVPCRLVRRVVLSPAQLTTTLVKPI